MPHLRAPRFSPARGSWRLSVSRLVALRRARRGVAHQFRLQHQHYTTHLAATEFLLIARSDTPIGRVYLFRPPSEIRVMEISLLEAERGQGFGGAIMQALLDEADAAGLEVTLHVEPYNRARHLYERLGLVAGEQQGVYLHMCRKPRPDGAASRTSRT